MTDNVRRIINRLRTLFSVRTMQDQLLMRLIYMDCRFRNCVSELRVRYVEEAERVFETRVQACQQRGEDHLHVYVS